MAFSDQNIVIKTGIIAAIIYCVIVLSIRPFIPQDGKMWDNFLTSILFPGMLFLAHLFMYQYLRKNGSTFHYATSQLLLTGLVFSISVGLIAGVSHYIHASYLNPNWAQEALEVARQGWAESGYSEEAIAGQVELTDTFQNPVKWGAVSMAFIIVLSTVFSLLIVGYLKLQERLRLVPA